LYTLAFLNLSLPLHICNQSSAELAKHSEQAKEALRLQRIGYLPHCALWTHAFLLLETLPCKVVGQINVLGALVLNRFVEHGEGCCIVCVKPNAASAAAITASPKLLVLLQLSEL
jgi:hypothetical protein